MTASAYAGCTRPIPVHRWDGGVPGPDGSTVYTCRDCERQISLIVVPFARGGEDVDDVEPP